MKQLLPVLLVPFLAGGLWAQQVNPTARKATALAMATTQKRMRKGGTTRPLTGILEIRRPLRGLRFIRERLLEESIGSRFALGGKIELLLFDSTEDLPETLALLGQYRALVQSLLTIPVAQYLEDPGTREALVRAIEWGNTHALAVPRIHRLGYLRIQPVLDGDLDLSPPLIFGGSN